MPATGEYARYRVVDLSLGRTPLHAHERVLVMAVSSAGDSVFWTADPGRSPALGTEIEVCVRRYEDDPPPDDPPDAGRQSDG